MGALLSFAGNLVLALVVGTVLICAWRSLRYR